MVGRNMLAGSITNAHAARRDTGSGVVVVGNELEGTLTVLMYDRLAA